MKILAISGSLRAQSTNTMLLQAAKILAPPHLDVVLYNELGNIPPFNPDLDVDPGPESVSRFRLALRGASAIIFSTPEYAHGVPGTLKNALDWVVGSGEFSRKPVVLFNASARAEYAQASLKEVLKAMDARILADAEITIAAVSRDTKSSEIAADPEFARLIFSSLEKIAGSISDDL